MVRSNRINPNALGLALAILLVGIVGLTVGTWMGRQIGYAQGIAEQVDCR